MCLVVPCTQQIISSVRVRWLLLSPMPTWYSDIIVTVKLQKTNYKVLIIIIKCSFKGVDPIFNKPAKIRNFRGINLFVPPLSDQRCPDRSNHQQDQSRSDRSGRSELPPSPNLKWEQGCHISSTISELPCQIHKMIVVLRDQQEQSCPASPRPKIDQSCSTRSIRSCCPAKLTRSELPC